MNRHSFCVVVVGGGFCDACGFCVVVVGGGFCDGYGFFVVVVLVVVFLGG